MDGWDGIYLRQLGTLEHLAVLKNDLVMVLMVIVQPSREEEFCRRENNLRLALLVTLV